MAATLRVGVVLAAIDGYPPAEAVRLLRMFAEATIPAPKPAPLFQPGLRWIGTEWQSFRCERLKATIPVRDCLVRRTRIWPSGGGRGCPRYAECQGCHQGEDNAESCAGIHLPPSTLPREMLPNSQRLAKRARALVGLEDDEPVRVDPLKEASEMTRTDENDWRA